MLETIGHYQIRRQVGAGGMGVVYEGWDDRLQRTVAISERISRGILESVSG